MKLSFPTLPLHSLLLLLLLLCLFCLLILPLPSTLNPHPPLLPHLHLLLHCLPLLPLLLHCLPFLPLFCVISLEFVNPRLGCMIVTHCSMTKPTPASQSSPIISLLPDTITYDQACLIPKWHLAMSEEHWALKKNHTWKLTINRYKAHLVAKGYN